MKCAGGHAFDLSRDGYVNLLLSKRGGSWETGDSREMLRARRAFLEGGHFDFLHDDLVERTKRWLLRHKPSSSRILNILDIGCGEGHYVGKLSKSLEGIPAGTFPAVEWYGMDVSKDGVQLASRKHPLARFLLSNVHHHIPFTDGSISVASSIFSPRNFGEFARVLEPGGLLLIAIPTPAHLQELREFVKMLKIDEDKEAKLLQSLGDFVLVESSALEGAAALGANDLRNLVTMSPNFRHNPDLENLSRISGKLTVSFSIKVLELARA